MLADTDAGNVVAAAHSGARWGYSLPPLVLLLIPMLYMGPGTGRAADVAGAALVFLQGLAKRSSAVVIWASHPSLAAIGGRGAAVGQFEFRHPGRS